MSLTLQKLDNNSIEYPRLRIWEWLRLYIWYLMKGKGKGRQVENLYECKYTNLRPTNYQQLEFECEWQLQLNDWEDEWMNV